MYYPVIDKQTLYENLHIYLFLTVLIIFVGIFVYIKLKFPFWNVQPVFHTYDFMRTMMYREPFFIYKRPMTTKFCDFKQISTMSFVDCSDEQKKGYVNLLQCFFIPSENANFMFHLENLETYMGSHLSTSYISLYEIAEYISTENSNTYKKKYLGGISSRSGKLSIGPFETPIYFIDFVSIHRELGISSINYSRKLLQTHIYRQQKETPEIMASIFKKEGEPYTGIVPFVTSSSAIFGTPSFFPKEVLKLPEHFIFINFHKGNIDILFDFLDAVSSRYTTFCMTDRTNLARMIEDNVLFCYGIKKLDEIYAVYFFRDMRTQYEEVGLSGCLLQLAGSIHNTTSEELFYKGFQKSLKTIMQKMPLFTLLMIEDIGSNRILYDKIGGLPMLSTKSTYYLYNIVVPCSPVLGSQCFVLF